MLSIFSANGGSTRGAARSVIIPGDQNLPALIYLQGFGAQVGFSAMLTGFGINEAVLAQIRPMIGPATYAYVFNNAPVDVQISGVAFSNDCGGSPGLGLVRRFYANNRASRRNTTISFAIAPGIPFRGLLLGASYGIQDPGSLISGFTFNLKMVGDDD